MSIIQSERDVLKSVVFKVDIMGVGPTLNKAWEDAVDDFHYDPGSPSTDLKKVSIVCPQCGDYIKLNKRDWDKLTVVVCSGCGWHGRVQPL